MGLFVALSAQHKWNRLIIAFSSPTMISYFMLPFVSCLICVTVKAKFMSVCVPRDSSLWFVALVAGKCILNCTETLLHPQTGRSQITSQLLSDCSHRGREREKKIKIKRWIHEKMSEYKRKNYFIPSSVGLQVFSCQVWIGRCMI